MQPSWRLQPAAFPVLWPHSPPTSSQSSSASSWTPKQHVFPVRVLQSCFGCAGLLAGIKRRLRESRSSVPRLAIKNFTKSWPQKDVPVAWAWAGAKPGTSKRRRGRGGTLSCERLSEIARMYDAFTFDFDEMLEVASEADDVLKCLRQLCQMGRKVVLISEHPARSGLYMEQLQAQGVDVEALAGIVTAGELLHQYLSLQQKRLGENVLWIAASSDLKAPEDQLNLVEHGYKPEASIDKADFILCTGGRAVFAATDYQQESAFAEDGKAAPFRPLFRQASSRGLPMLCLGTLDERIVDGQTHFLPARLASSYKDLDGKVVYFGRPQTAVFDEVLRLLEEAGMDLLESKVAHIGLCHKRDVAGAFNAGFSSVLLRADKLQSAGNDGGEEQSMAPSGSPTIELQSFRW